MTKLPKFVNFNSLSIKFTKFAVEKLTFLDHRDLICSPFVLIVPYRATLGYVTVSLIYHIARVQNGIFTLPGEKHKIRKIFLPSSMMTKFFKE